MPNKEGKLTDEEKKQAKDWIEKKWQPLQRNCPSCGVPDSWVIADHLVSPPIYRGGDILIGGASYPQLMLVCMNCAFTFYFNAIVMGLFSVAEEEETAEAGGSHG